MIIAICVNCNGAHVNDTPNDSKDFYPERTRTLSQLNKTESEELEARATQVKIGLCDCANPVSTTLTL